MESNHPAVPRARHSFDLRMDDGAVIRIRQHGTPGAPRLVLSHGNGLAIDGYYPFWGPLRERYEVVLFDFRNHGHNPPHREDSHTWQRFVLDMEAVFAAIQQELGTKRTAGVFHSLSGVVSALHSLRFGPRFDALVLFDPPLFPPEGHPLRQTQSGDKNSLGDRARQRMERYSDPSILAGQFRRRFKHWVPDAYELMARATLRHDSHAGDWVLACPRDYEANIFSTPSDQTLWSKMGSLPVPAKLICGDPTLPETTAPTLIGLQLAREHRIPYEAIAGTTHFLQVEKPAECANAMESFLRQFGLAAE